MMNSSEFKKLRGKREILVPVYREFKGIYTEIDYLRPQILEKIMDETIQKLNLSKKETKWAEEMFKIWQETVYSIGLNRTELLFEDEILN